MEVHTDKNESYDEPNTYNSLLDMLDKKYARNYPERYNNVEKFSDKHTEVRLFHSPPEKDYKVVLTYYDKDSGYIEDQEKGF